ncbi:MAG: hypothetical protein ACE5IY_01845 [bacterium]
MSKQRYLCGLLAGLWLFSCTRDPNAGSASTSLFTDDTKSEKVSMDTIAEAYVQLVLEIGLYDPDYVDAYYGPEEWRPDENEKLQEFPVTRLRKEIEDLQKQLDHLERDDLIPLHRLRRTFLEKQLIAVAARIDILAGKQLTFDQESQVLYDAVAPHHSVEHFEKLLLDLDGALPGAGSVSERLETFKKEFVIPKEKLDAVFQAAISEARKRTQLHIDLPANENFTVEYVTHKPWSGYNWYKGNHFSLIQVNTDLPIYIDRAIDLACHEGYPGHHVFNVLLENQMVRSRQWMEFSVYPLFSPQSLIAEGSANYGIEVAFPGEERVEFEREVLFKLAGLDPANTEKYYEIHEMVTRLSYAGNEAARQYLDGKISAEQAAEWLTKYALMPPDRAKQRVSFIEKYRSYVINYNLGQDIVKNYVESNGGTSDNPAKRWQLFAELLATPKVASGLIRQSGSD